MSVRLKGTWAFRSRLLILTPDLTMGRGYTGPGATFLEGAGAIDQALGLFCPLPKTMETETGAESEGEVPSVCSLVGWPITECCW